jgi:hypothetical protein
MPIISTSIQSVASVAASSVRDADANEFIEIFVCLFVCLAALRKSTE